MNYEKFGRGAVLYKTTFDKTRGPGIILRVVDVRDKSRPYERCIRDLECESNERRVGFFRHEQFSAYFPYGYGGSPILIALALFQYGPYLCGIL